MSITAPPGVDALPEGPANGQPKPEFNAKGRALVAALGGIFRDQLITLGSWMLTTAQGVEINAQAVQTAAAAAAGLEHYKGLHDPGENYAQGESVKSGGQFWIANRANTGVTPVEGLDWTKANFFNATVTTDENVTAQRFTNYTLIGEVDVTFPVDPADGDWISTAVTSLGINSWMRRNGKTIGGLDEDCKLSRRGLLIYWIYDAENTTWWATTKGVF